MLDKKDLDQIRQAIGLLNISKNCQIECKSRKVTRFFIDGEKPHLLIKQLFNIKILPVLIDSYSDSFVFELNLKTKEIKAAKIDSRGKLTDIKVISINQ